MTPDYTTFIRFQDKRNILLIYLITLMLLGFYWKNSGYTFGKEDIWSISAILGLTVYSFIADLKAYWAYKYFVRSVDLTCFIENPRRKMNSAVFTPVAVSLSATLIFSGLIWSLFSITSAGWTLVTTAIAGPLIIWGVYAIVRPVYINQLIVVKNKPVKRKRLPICLAVTIIVTVVMNMLTVAPLGHSEKFQFYGHYFTIESIITMAVVCGIVLAINLLFSRFSKRYIFLGYFLMDELNASFSTHLPWRYLFERPLWLRLLILFFFQLFWISFVALLTTLSSERPGFAIYFLLCYIPCLGYYALHIRWKWHDDFVMACDMCLRWNEISKINALW